jgi:hypothetical protein
MYEKSWIFESREIAEIPVPGGVRSDSASSVTGSAQGDVIVPQPAGHGCAMSSRIVFLPSTEHISGYSLLNPMCGRHAIHG